MKINWKIRFINPAFWWHLVGAFFVPILAHAGFSWQQVTSWPMLVQLVTEAFASPALVVSILWSIWNFMVDPTTKGLSDSVLARSYTEPKED